MTKIDRRTELAELDDDATEGQQADYFAAELSGDLGAWGIGIVEYHCPNCDRWFQSITDELQNFDPLIVSWHEKAKEGDYFSRFVFEYLAFIAILKNKLFISADSDRKAIQALKQNSVRGKRYMQVIENSEPLRNLWLEVMTELNKMPLHNSSRDLDYQELDVWWNNSGFKSEQKDDSPKGIVESLSDWGNMAEFWYAVRNNLFHGGKDPTIKRDCFLVEHAYRTLAVFMENEIASMR